MTDTPAPAPPTPRRRTRKPSTDQVAPAPGDEAALDDATRGRIARPLWPLAVPIASLNLDPANARVHPDRNMAAIQASLGLYGQRKPIVARTEGRTVTAGNGTLEAARALGWTHVAAVVLDDDAMTAAGFAVADNRTAELAEWDPDALAAVLAEIPDVPGFTDDEVSQLLALLPGPGDAAPGDTPPAEPWTPTAPSQEFVRFSFGAHSGLVGRAAYDSFVSRMKADQAVNAGAMIADVVARMFPPVSS